MKVKLPVIKADVGLIDGLLAPSRALLNKERLTELGKRFTVTN